MLVVGITSVTFVVLILTLDSQDEIEEAAADRRPHAMTSSPREADLKPASTIQLPDHHAVLAMDDPDSDGWDSEVFHERAKKQLEKLGQLLISDDNVSPETLAPFLSADFACGPLVPSKLSPEFEDAALRVERATEKSAQPVDHGLANRPRPVSYRGAEGLAEAIRRVSEPLRSARDARFMFKVVRVEPGADMVTTQQYVSVSGRTARGIVEQHSSWEIQWTPGQHAMAPRLKWIGVEDFEQVITKTDGTTLLLDCTEAALQHNGCYRKQLLRGLNHWLARIPYRTQSNFVGMPGIALGDVNGDGLEDIYLCQDPGIPNLLFLQNADGTLRDESDAWGVNWLQDSRGALFVDLDNDGDQDLAVAILGGVVLAANERKKRFQIRDVISTGEDTTSLTAVDYDQDGRLDLHVCVYSNDTSAAESLATPITIVGARHIYHDSVLGGANLLLRNEITKDGEWRFEDVTKQVGLDVDNRRWSYAASWEDFDNDQDLDLYVANDFGPNHLFRNDQLDDQRRRFVNIAKQTGTSDRAFGMSAHWGDFNRDGHIDLYVGNMFSAAGNRITYQRRFKPKIPPEEQQRFRYMTRGNTLLQNAGNGTFVDVSQAMAVTLGRWAWNSRFVDLNNDGWLDLVVANGFVTNEETSDL